MATENYGAFAQLIASVANTPVSTDTIIIFIGACASGDLNEAKLITSMADYSTLLGGAPGDGYNLTEAAIAAFQIAGINKCYMIPVSHSTTYNAADYVGNAGQFTGVHAVEKLFMNSPTAVNILCMPSISDGTAIAELMSVAKKANGHWDSFVLYDVTESDDQLNAVNAVDVDEVVDAKQLSDEFASAVWGHVKTSGGYIVSGAAIRACLMAVSDAGYGVPARSGGNLPINGIQGICLNAVNSEVFTSDEQATLAPGVASMTIKIDGISVDYIDGVEYEIDEVTATGDLANCRLEKGTIGDQNGKLILKFDTLESVVSGVVVTYYYKYSPQVVITENAATQLSADGICSYINYGGGLWHTWGDHTSAFSGGTVSDERARFDNTIRMNIMITNRFQLKYRFEIDNPMTLQMRNDVINEELDFLNSLVSIGGLIGEPSVEFRAADNGSDQVSQGYFTWTTQDTPTIPSKYMLNKVAYTQAGLYVYTQNA